MFNLTKPVPADDPFRPSAKWVIKPRSNEQKTTNGEFRLCENFSTGSAARCCPQELGSAAALTSNLPRSGIACSTYPPAVPTASPSYLYHSQTRQTLNSAASEPSAKSPTTRNTVRRLRRTAELAEDPPRSLRERTARAGHVYVCFSEIQRRGSVTEMVSFADFPLSKANGTRHHKLPLFRAARVWTGFCLHSAWGYSLDFNRCFCLAKRSDTLRVKSISRSLLCIS